MREINLNELRVIHLELLDAIDEFCKTNNLRYSLGGGTLLGAVRHNGFIPWDDDVDVMMPRPDYEVFLKKFNYKHISIQHPGNCDEAYIPFAKVYDTRTVLYEHYATNGVFVDVFPIDGLPSDKTIADYCKLQNRYLSNLYKIHDYKTKDYLEYDKSLPQWLVRIKYWLKHFFYISRKNCIRALDKLYSTYDFETSDYAGAISGAYGMKEHMHKYVFTKYIAMRFEDRNYMCIAHYDEYLTKHYGDYMTLPPADKRESPHTFKAYWKN